MKHGKFVGQFDRLATAQEIEAFTKVIKSAAEKAGFDYLLFKVGEQPKECGFYGHSMLPVTLDTGKFTRIKKGNGDEVYDFSTVTLMISLQDGFSSYEKCKEYEQKNGGHINGFGNDQFDFKGYSISGTTDGKYHEYRKHHRHDFNYEGKGHFMYWTEIPEFEADLVEYFGNLKKGL